MLTQDQAVKRAALVDAGIEYELYLHLSANDDYHGVVRCHFTSRQSQPVFLDFAQGNVSCVTINGNELSRDEVGEVHREGKINISQNHVLGGSNEVVIAFNNSYSNSGQGLHAFSDPDGTFYAYCQTEPYYCCCIFPVFDQPDLKGHITIHINHPRELLAVANTAVEKEETSNGFSPDGPFEHLFFALFPGDFSAVEWVTTSFKRTPRLPSYLFAFALGHFALAAQSFEGSVPMRMYCRASLVEKAKAQSFDLFAFARHGVAFFSEFFHTPFPFEKLDMLFGPEYIFGAMEYPGLVTFNDHYIYRDPPTTLQQTARGRVVLHELAHMWFGDYVTMRWWNDLWLNESFAEVACFIALDAIAPSLGFPVIDSWSSFAAEKDWGYTEDQLETTHPIAGEVPNTSSAESIFDGITYSKGAAVLKQLLWRVGKEAFSRGLKSYFARFKWANATLDDFLAELSAAAVNLDATEWKETWIKAAGLNSLEAQWQPGAEAVTLMQSAVLEEHPTLRRHALVGAFFSPDGSVKQLVPFELLPCQTTVVTTLVPECAAFLPNSGDWGYIKVVLDDESSKFFRRNLAALEGQDQFVALQALCESVYDARLHPFSFLDAILGPFVESVGPVTLHAGLLALTDIIDLIPAASAAPHADRAFLRIIDQLMVEKDADLRKELKHCGLRLARSMRSVEVLAELMLRAADHSLNFTAEEEWGVLLSATGWGVSSEVLSALRTAAEAKGERDFARYFSLSLDALTCDAETRSELEATLFDNGCKFSHTEIKYVVLGLTHRALPADRLASLLNRFEEEFPHVAETAAQSVWRSLLRIVDSNQQPEDSLRRLVALLPKISSEKKAITDALRKKISSIKRAMKVHERFFTTTPNAAA